MNGAPDPRAGGGRPGGLVYLLAGAGAFGLLLVAGVFLLLALALKGEAPVGRGPFVGVVELSGPVTASRPVLDELRRMKGDPRVKAVVFRVDSPGGAVGSAQEIFEELLALDREKPVVASFENVAASGGYYAALGARKIYALPGTLTGSIGVIVRVPNLGPLLKRLGVNATVLKSAPLKDLGSVTRGMSEEEKEAVRRVLQDVHRQFVEAVAERRGLSEEEAARLADGRIMTGREAKALGLVDELGGFSRAVREAGRLGGISGEPKILETRRGRLQRLRELLEEEGGAALRGLVEKARW